MLTWGGDEDRVMGKGGKRIEFERKLEEGKKGRRERSKDKGIEYSFNIF